MRIVGAAVLRCCVVLLAVISIIATVTPASPARAAVTTTLTNLTTDGRQATRFDVDGNPLDAHDGTIANFAGVYYLYGTSYDCGYEWRVNDTFCGFKVYSSPDLQSWTDRGFVVAAKPCTNCFRPHVVYNARTARYVMWTNDHTTTAGYRVYTATEPTGPFTEAPLPHLPAATPCTGDLGLFVDADATGYLACSNVNWHVAIIRLTGDYLQPSTAYRILGVSKVEAPSLFRRGNTYYLSLSDPNCGYCTTAGTSYLRASAPLGPWHGTSDPWQVSSGRLHVRGGLYGLAAIGSTWRNYTFHLDAAPGPIVGSTHVQAGWAIRMAKPDYGYLLLLNGTATAHGTLSVLVRAGKTIRSHVVTLPFVVKSGVTHHVSTTASGHTLTTYIDGRRVDTFSDSTYSAGTVGLREWNGAATESAVFDNAAVTSGTTTLLHDTFSSSTLAAWVAPMIATKISNNSCGGQPAAVAPLTDGSGNPVYLYMSDLWDNAPNEALANFHWEPLRFTSTGSISSLGCKNSTVSLAGTAAVTTPAADLDQSSGADGFSPACVVTSHQSFGQTFTVGRSGRLHNIHVNVFGNGTETGQVPHNLPSTPLTVAIRTVPGDATVGTTLWSTSIDPAQVGWAGHALSGNPDVDVTSGQQLELVLSTNSPRGCYGVQTSALDPYPRGSAVAGSVPRTTTDLKFETTVISTDPA